MAKGEYSHPKWREKAYQLKKETGFKCELCASGKQLEVHHKRYIPNRSVWEYPRSLLQVLCFRCHKNVHKRSAAICNYDDCENEIETRYEYCFDHYTQSLKERAADAENALKKVQIERDKHEEARKLAEAKLKEVKEKNARELKDLRIKEIDTQSELDRLEKEREKAKEETNKIKRELEGKVTSLKNEQKERVAAQNELLKKKKQKDKVIDEHSAKIIEKTIEREVKEIESKANFEIQKELAEIEQQANAEILKFKEQEEFSSSRIKELSSELTNYKKQIADHGKALENAQDEWDRAIASERETSRELELRVGELQVAIKEKDEEINRLIAIKEREDEMQRKHNKKMISLMVVILISILGLAAIIIRNPPPPPPPIEDQRQYSHLIKCPDGGCSGVMRYISQHNFFGCTNYKPDKTGCPQTLSAPLRCPDHNTTFQKRVEDDKGYTKYWVCNRTDICRRNYKYSDIFSNHVICPTPKCGGVLKLKTSSKNPNFKFLGCPNYEENDCEIVNFPLACKKHKVDMVKQERGGQNYWVCKKYDNCRYYHFR